MESSLLDAFDRPVAVTVRDHTFTVGALTLGDLADLQAWLRDHSWDPWDVPDPGRIDLALALVIVHANAWPPPLGSRVADLATDSEDYAAEFAHVAFGRSNGLDRDFSAKVGRAARADGVPWLRISCAAYGERPEHAANRLLNAHDGARPEPPGEPSDWALSIAGLVLGSEERRGLSFAEAEALTLPQYRLLCRAGRDKEGRFRLTTGPAARERARPDEHWKAARMRRAALIDEATALLEARYAADRTNGEV